MRRAAVAVAALLFALSASGAVDTAGKRASVVNMAGYQPPIPDGSITEGDRAHLAMVYSGFDYGAASQVSVPNVVGLSTTNADTALEAVSLDTGTVTDRCSGFADDTVLSQSPIAGAQVNTGTTVDLEASNGMACPSPGQRPGVRLPGIRLPGL